ncbi:unnamed protein product [Cylindrotheca closterium]|uniref:Gamma-interferon-inducible lysosomal thiol reductase n=1 Tax=Cylindrotheca closterium TaxID=2856 RepID=A0AAD2JP54_9STRA|nr:unnamed protein product [Cylindrotheca closterium]
MWSQIQKIEENESIHSFLPLRSSKMTSFGTNWLLLALALLLLKLSDCATADEVSSEKPKVVVRFYGEAQCPFCRKFVTEVWQPIWEDLELRNYIDYDFVPWGNAYFATKQCGSGPYNSVERACWYKNCINEQSDGKKDCFDSEAVVYQHGQKEGDVDVYESCIKTLFGLDYAVEFTYCAEGPKMDNKSQDSKALMKECAGLVIPKVDFPAIDECFDLQGRKLEIHNARNTPEHPGVPYVLIEGAPIDDIAHTKETICKRLEEKALDPLPKACRSERQSFLRHFFSKIRGT